MIDTENKFKSLSPRNTYNLVATRFMSLTGAASFGIMAFIFIGPSIQLLMSAETVDIVTLCIFPLFSILFLLLAILGVVSAHVRLVTSPAGIEYYQIGYRISTSWENIERLGQVSYGRSEVFGLILRQPAFQRNKWLGWTTPAVRQPNQGIPLEPFLVRWRNSELENDLKRYLPHLFKT